MTLFLLQDTKEDVGRYFSKYFLLCPTEEEKKSYGIGNMSMSKWQNFQ